MSAKVSAAASASAGSNISGGKPSAASNAAPAGGNAGADGVAATPGARGSAAPGTNAGPGAGSGGRFSSAMADAAQAGEQTTDAQLGKLNAEGASGYNTAAANPATSASTPTPSTSTASTPGVSAPEIDADVAQLLNPAAGKQNSSPPVSTATAGSGKPGAKSSTGTRGTGADTATTAPTEPVMLAMLLAASGMQLTGAGGAGGASDAAAGAAGSAGDCQSAISVTRLAARITAGLPASDPGVDAASGATTTTATTAATAAASAAASGAGNGAALAAQAAAPEATNSPTGAAGTTGGSAGAGGGADASDKSALSAGRSAVTDTTPAQPSIMTDSSGLPELVRSFAGSATQAPSVEASISVPVANGGWPPAVAAQVHWFVSNDIQSATLRLSPEHLGPVEVRIDVHDSQVNVNFSAAHAETRAALEQTVPRLREIFAGSGLTLGQANVQQDPRPGSQSSPTPARPAFTATQAVEPVAVATPQGLGLVDEYA
jgi:flagellar hook-length control protein FliK